MKRYTNNILIASCAFVLGVLAAGAYYHHSATVREISQPAPLVSCASGDKFDMLTGKPCLNISSAPATTSEPSR